MLETYKIAYSGGINEIIEKKSRFIATVFPIHSEEEANGMIESIRKKYWDASHHCFSYVLGDKQQVQRYSDDGEPSGTAGRPMLDVLLGEDIHDVLVIVTRYFGGTLLGTGGLVRAYSKAVQAGLANSRIIEKRLGIKYIVDTDYNGIGKIQYILGQMDLYTLNTEYTEAVAIEVMVPVSKREEFEKKITEASSGRAKIEASGETYFGILEGKLMLL